MSKCKDCIYGGFLIGQRNSIFLLSKAIKKVNNKIVEIDYNNNDFGCRLSLLQAQQDICLNDNFKNFKKGEFNV